MPDPANNISSVSSTSAYSIPSEPAIPDNYSFMPEPALGGDAMARLEELMLDLKMKDKQHAREMKHYAEKTIEAAVEKVVDEMNAKADAQLVAGIVGGASQVVSGALSIYGSAEALSVDVPDAGQAAGEGAQLVSARIGEATSQMSATTQLYGGAGTIVEGLGTATSGYYQSEATRKDGAITQGQATLSAGERNASAAQEDENMAAQELRDLLAKIDRILQAEQESIKAALFRA